MPNTFLNSLALLEELLNDFRFGMAFRSSQPLVDVECLRMPRWSGSVFAYALRLGLGQMDADADDGGKITSSALRDFVIRKVPELTQPKQKPTYRRESVEFDDQIFYAPMICVVSHILGDSSCALPLELFMLWF